MFVLWYFKFLNYLAKSYISKKSNIWLLKVQINGWVLLAWLDSILRLFFERNASEFAQDLIREHSIVLSLTGPLHVKNLKFSFVPIKIYKSIYNVFKDSIVHSNVKLWLMVMLLNSL